MLLVLIEDRESGDLQVSDATQHTPSTSYVAGTTLGIGFGVPSTHDMQMWQEPWVSMKVDEVHQMMWGDMREIRWCVDKKEKLNNENWLQGDAVPIDH